jgi:hypothetical protein
MLAGREDAVERAVHDLLEAMASGSTSATGTPSTPTGSDAHGGWHVLGGRPDGPGALRPHAILGGRSEQTTRRLALLERLVERAQETTGGDWLGIYQRRLRPQGAPCS